MGSIVLGQGIPLLGSEVRCIHNYVQISKREPRLKEKTDEARKATTCWKNQ